MFDERLIWRPDFDVAAFDWLTPRIGRHAAFGTVNHVLCHGLPSSMPWARDARDMGALMGLMGTGKEHNRKVAEDLLAEPCITPTARLALTGLLRHFDGKAPGRGRPAASPLMTMRDNALAMHQFSAHAQGRSFEGFAKDVGPDVELGFEALRKLRTQRMAGTAPRSRGRRRKK